MIFPLFNFASGELKFIGDIFVFSGSTLKREQFIFKFDNCRDDFDHP